MRRRDFIQIVAGTAAGWPSAVGAQQPTKWRIGFLHPGLPTTVAHRIVSFRQGLGSASLREAADADIVVRAANEQPDKLPAMAVELVKLGVQAICALAPPAIHAAREATSSVPIIAMDLESDPVANGWAASLAHPGGNVTGIFLDLPGFSAKTLQLLVETVLGIQKAALLWHPATGSLQLESVRTAASALNVMVEVFEVTRPVDFEGVFQAMAKSHVTGVLMLSSPLFADNLRFLAELALRNRLPAINTFPDFPQNGGLIGYGPDLQSLLKQTGLLTRKVLQGASAGDLPSNVPHASS